MGALARDPVRAVPEPAAPLGWAVRRAGFGPDFGPANQPNIVGLQRKAKTAEEGFRACVKAGPGTPQSCKDVNAMMRAAAANPALQDQALDQIERLQELTAKQITRSYVKLVHAENEQALGRVYGGLHFLEGCTAGLRMGNRVADWVYARALRP